MRRRFHFAQYDDICHQYFYDLVLIINLIRALSVPLTYLGSGGTRYFSFKKCGTFLVHKYGARNGLPPQRFRNKTLDLGSLLT